jgi:predicted transcriptional regulator
MEVPMSIEALKTILVEKIIYSQDEDALEAAFAAMTSHETGQVRLTPGQRAAIREGQEDLQAGRLFSQETIDREDTEWL